MHTIEDTLISVKEQIYSNIEHIIIDGKSTDKTLQIANCYPHLSKIKSEKDSGIYDAMNKGISLSTGQVIGILNSDDIYTNEHVIRDVMSAFVDEDVDAVYGDLNYVRHNDLSKVVRKWKAESHSIRKWRYGWMPPHPTFFVRKHIYKKFGTFNLNLKSAADYEIMLRFLYKHKINVRYLPKVLVHMRIGGQSNASLKNRLIANKEDRLAWEINGLKPYPFTTYLKPIRKIHQFLKR